MTTPGEALDNKFSQQAARADLLEARIVQLELLAQARGEIPLEEEEVGEPDHPRSDALGSGDPDGDSLRGIGSSGTSK